MVGLHFFCSEVFPFPLVSFSSVDHLGPLFPYHLSKKMCLLCPHTAYIQGQRSDLHIGLVLSQSRGQAWVPGKELLKIIEKNTKVKSLRVSACLDPGRWGSLGLTLAARPGLSLPKTGLLSSCATTTLEVHKGLALGPQWLQRYGSIQSSGSLFGVKSFASVEPSS